MIVTVYADDLALFANTPAQVETYSIAASCQHETLVSSGSEVNMFKARCSHSPDEISESVHMPRQ